MASLKEETAVLQEYKVVHDQLQGCKVTMVNDLEYLNHFFFTAHLLRTANLTSATSKASSPFPHRFACGQATFHPQEEIEQHVATTEKLKWQLLSLQNALMDGMC